MPTTHHSPLTSRGIRCEVHETGRMKHDFQRRDEAIRAAGVNELPAATGHRLTLQGITEKRGYCVAYRGWGNIVVRAQARGTAFFLQSLRGGPILFGLNDQELWHANTCELQRPAGAA